MSTLLFLPITTIKYYLQPYVYILPHLNKFLIPFMAHGFAVINYTQEIL